MSALDMVLQRQVPARSAAKTGDANTGPDAGSDSRNDAFSAALSNEKRNAVAERDKVEANNQTDAEPVEPDDQAMPEDGQSDEIMTLLAGLMSSASYSDEAGLGGDAPAEPRDPEAVTAEADADANAVDPAIDELAVAAAPKTTISVADAAGDASAKPADKPVRDDAARIDQRQPAGEPARAATAATVPTGARAGESPAAPVPASAASAETSSAAVLTAAAGMAGKGAQTQQRTVANDGPADRPKEPSALKEAMQALGLEKGSQSTDAETARTPVRGRSAQKQAGIADRQERLLDEHAGARQGKVEVIESRRFMASQSMSANAQSLTRSLAEAGGVALAAHRAAPAHAISQPGLPQAAQTLHTLKLQLNPVSLGSVTAVLKLSGDELSVELKVETAEAYRQLKEDNQSILKALRGQGFGVEQITVQHVAGSDRSSGQAPQQGFQANQQGAGSGDAQSSGRESGRNNTGQQGSSHQGGQAHEQASYTGPGAGRTDGVYL